MSESTHEKAVCAHCGVDVRENTQFCYNCGKPVTAEAIESAAETVPTDAAGDETELEKTLGVDSEPDSSSDKLAVAAANRRKARVTHRKPVEMVWEPADEGAYGVFVLITLIIALIAAAIVFIAVYLK